MVNQNNAIGTALGGHQQPPPDWMPASEVRALFEDPAIIWLEYYGHQHDFQRDSSPYDFLDFIGRKGHQFEEKWIQEIAPGAIQVCHHADEVRSSAKVKETFELIQKGVPVITQPALWWAPERIYGAPDLIVHTSWIQERLPELAVGDQPNHYVAIDHKFTTKLDQTSKAKDLANYTAQVRIYSYILGQLQGLMPSRAYLVTRDRVRDPLPIDVVSIYGQPLDSDLASLRDHFVEIKVNGADYAPWKDDIVAVNLSHQDDRWSTAKKIIALEKTPGGDLRLVYQIGDNAKKQLLSMGYPSRASFLQKDPDDTPFEDIKGIGGKKAERIRAILRANRSGTAVMPPSDSIPGIKRNEVYIDFEYFTDVNVDFDTQWPTLEGREMIFMIGIGRQEDGEWRFDTLTAEAEDQTSELELFTRFIHLLDKLTDGAYSDQGLTAMYHWSSAEVWQSRRAADRHQLPDDHTLRNLPWVDLQKAFLNGPGAIPGSWKYGLKKVAKSLGEYDTEYAVQWPGELDEGLTVMVMGWRAYEDPDPLLTPEMETIRRYLETDCRALQEILRWLRGNGPSTE